MKRLSFVLVGALVLAACQDAAEPVDPPDTPAFVLASTSSTEDFCTGWDERDGFESGFVECQSAVVRDGPEALHIKRDNFTWKVLSQPLTGMVEFTAWALPAKDNNTNFAVRMGGERPTHEAISVSINETNQWFYSVPGQLQVPTGVFYKKDWTHLGLLIDTESQTYSFSIDGVEVAADKGPMQDISGGIRRIGLLSGRAAGGHSSYLEILSFMEVEPSVDIDIKPGSDPNSINCNNEKESIAVAILTTDDFDATTVDHTTVTFEGASETHVNKKTGEPRRHEEDVDDDGDTDLVFHFRFGETDLTCDDTEATLTGETFDGTPIMGTDAIRTVGSKKFKEVSSVTLSVSSRQAWQATGLDVQVGDEIAITASGVIRFDDAGRSATPDGQIVPAEDFFADIGADGTCTNLLCGVVTGTLRAQSLVGKIGTPDLTDFTDGFFVGSSFTMTAPKAGSLLLGFNDGFVRADRSGLDSGGVGDNSGSFSVTVTINRAN